MSYHYNTRVIQLYNSLNIFQYISPSLGNDQKDLIISQLKAEVFELTQNEKDFEEINGSLKNLEHRYALLKDDKARTEAEFKARQDAGMQTMANLKTDIDTLKAALSEKNIECQELKTENLALKDIAEHRALDINKLRDELVQSINDCKKLEGQKRNLEDQLDSSQILNKRLTEECQHLQNYLDDALYKGVEKDKIIKEQELEAQQYLREQQSMHTALEELSRELKDRTGKLHFSEQKCNEAQKAILALESDLCESDRLIEKTKHEAKKFQDLYCEEEQKRQGCEKQIFDLEEIIKQQEDRSSDQQRNIEQLKLAHSNSMDQNYHLQQDIDNLRKQCEKLASINKELTCELDLVNQQDEQIRKLINRRTRLEQIKLQCEKGMAATMSTVNQITKIPNQGRLQTVFLNKSHVMYE